MKNSLQTKLYPVFRKSESWFREFRTEFTNYQPCVEGSSQKVQLSNSPSSSQYEPKYWNSHRRKDFGQIVAADAANTGILETADKFIIASSQAVHLAYVTVQLQ